MLFTSRAFLVFFVAVLAVYWPVRRSVRAQNVVLLLASYLFYGWWDYRFLALLAFTTAVDFTAGRMLSRAEHDNRRTGWLLVSLVSNLAVLGFFKYFNFFAGSFAALLQQIGLHADAITLRLVLPVGISFYTLQSLTYTIDLYKRRAEPVRSLLDYAVFVSMFPQLLAGPIMRARDMLPQIASRRTLTADRLNSAVLLILWGLFKKMVIADNLAQTVNLIFDHYADYQGLDLVIGALAFAVQIYGDFSGYSDIARGVAKLLGFELTLNFRLPYFSISPADFWTRWNISLSTWLRDYLYWPLMSTRALRLPGGLTTEFHAFRNMILTMLLGGLWHGASWNFVLWGGYWGVLLVTYRLIESEPPRNIWKRKYSALIVPGRMAVTFLLALVGWVFFRCTSVAQIAHFFTAAGCAPSVRSGAFALALVVYSAPLVAMQLWQYRSQNLLIATALRPFPRALLWCVLIFACLTFGMRESTEFIYFQF
jgi:alginate O-acetyltransferase complex protein AlgI